MLALAAITAASPAARPSSRKGTATGRAGRGSRRAGRRGRSGGLRAGPRVSHRRLPFTSILSTGPSRTVPGLPTHGGRSDRRTAARRSRRRPLPSSSAAVSPSVCRAGVTRDSASEHSGRENTMAIATDQPGHRRDAEDLRAAHGRGARGQDRPRGRRLGQLPADDARAAGRLAAGRRRRPGRATPSAVAELMTTEMGKTLAAAKAEVAKCAKALRWYAEHGPGVPGAASRRDAGAVGGRRTPTSRTSRSARSWRSCRGTSRSGRPCASPPRR